ncbi:MBL fold metallo-hydrolase [Sphingomonas hengshuiensis]|uniref:MBL fold metallo-hydrolase n=1 Tax=Sphingomonas hengshuiensis TaxID=1609977 RepID=UPI0005C9FBC7|nr:MBL fold metallo-hydrolase [Sphingomonas hengshuiensis]
MARIKTGIRWGLAVLLWSIVGLCLTVTVAPHFLDRIYYRGPVSGHFDGAHFFNPDGDDDRLVTHGPRSRTRMIAAQVFGDATRPNWPERVAVSPSRPPARVEGARMLVTWIGHASVLIQTSGINILTDPVWGERAGPFGIGPRRVAEPGVRFDDLPPIDLVVVSHNHYDHMELATLKRLWDRDRPRIVTSLGNDSVIAQAGVPSVALDWGQRLRLRPGIDVAVTRNHHWGSRWFADRNRALWSSFVVRLPGGNIFFAGDTGLGDGKWPAEAAALGPIRFAALPIGAFRFEEGQMAIGSHIGPRDAIRVWDGLGRPFALPIHWGTFRLSREGYATPPRMLRGMLACAGSDPSRFRAVPVGQQVEVPLAGQPPVANMGAIDACVQAGRFDALR